MFFQFFLPDANGIGGQVADNLQQGGIVLQIGLRRDEPVDTQCANDFFQKDDRHADERHLPVVVAGFSPVQKTVVVADVRHHMGFSCFRHMPGDPFADPVPPQFPLCHIQTV